jgi:hypothetical protein
MANIKLIDSKFIEIEAKRDPNFSGKLELKTNIKIISVEKTEKSKEMLKINYIFEADYKDLGKIKLNGLLFLNTDTKTVKKIIKNKEENDYSSEEFIIITNTIIQKASIKAFELEEELNLPIHIKLPSLSIKE